MDKTNTSYTPQTPIRGRHKNNPYPLSSPYSGKSPLPLPVLLPSQYDNPNNAFDSDDLIDNEKKVELFDRHVCKPEIIIPPIGSNIEKMPFFNAEKSNKFINSLNGINIQMNKLKKVNENVVELNESLGAYLFGLFQNAWCVNLNENISLETMDKVEEIKKLEKQINELKSQVEITKKTRESIKPRHNIPSERRKSTMPPPTITRFTKPPISRSPLERRISHNNNNIQSEDKVSKRTFLRAGSRNATFKQRQQRKSKQPIGLNLLSATKMKMQNANESDDSLSSVGDTSEVQTLSTIRRLERFQNNNINNSLSSKSLRQQERKQPKWR
jgi:hypothetical protein